MKNTGCSGLEVAESCHISTRCRTAHLALEALNFPGLFRGLLAPSFGRLGSAELSLRDRKLGVEVTQALRDAEPQLAAWEGGG